jgi:hypothetical protein
MPEQARKSADAASPEPRPAVYDCITSLLHNVVSPCVHVAFMLVVSALVCLLLPRVQASPAHHVTVDESVGTSLASLSIEYARDGPQSTCIYGFPTYI